MSPASKPWQQVTALVSLSAGGAITGFSFVPKTAADLSSTVIPQIRLLALKQAAQPAPTDDATLRSAIVNVASYYLKMAKGKTPAEMQAIIWQHDSIDGIDHGQSCAAFASLTLELAAQVVDQRSWVTGGTSYPWPLHKWADVRVDPNPGSLGITSVLQDAQAHHRWHPLGDGYQPLPGDWVLFDGHVEVITNYAGGILHTIGGDSLPNFSVNAHEYRAPLASSGVVGVVNNGNLHRAGTPAAGDGDHASGSSQTPGTSDANPAAAGQGDTSPAAPAQSNPSQSSPSQGDPGQGDPGQGGPSQSDPGQSTQGQNSPSENSPGKGTPSQNSSSQGTSSQGTSGLAAIPGAAPLGSAGAMASPSAAAPAGPAGPAGATPPTASQSTSGQRAPSSRGIARHVPVQHPPGKRRAVRQHQAGRCAAVPGATPPAVATPAAPPAGAATSRTATSSAAASGTADIPGLSVSARRRPDVPTSPSATPHSKRVPPPPAATPASAPAPDANAQREFIDEIAPGAVAAQRTYGVPAAVTIAQAIDESGWGRSDLATRDHNLFGIKGAGPAGSDSRPSQEYEDGQLLTHTAIFRVYHNAAESIDDHGKLLATSGYYRRAMAVRQDPNAFAAALTGVYATDPDYGTKLVTLMRRYNLYRYDAAVPTSPTSRASAGATSAGATSPAAAPSASPTGTASSATVPGATVSGATAPGAAAIPGLPQAAPPLGTPPPATTPPATAPPANPSAPATPSLSATPPPPAAPPPPASAAWSVGDTAATTSPAGGSSQASGQTVLDAHWEQAPASSQSRRAGGSRARRAHPSQYQQQIPYSVSNAFLATAKVPLTRAEPLYRDVASHCDIRWELLAACDWMQCEARPRYSPVHGEKLGAVNSDGTAYPTKSAALEQCADDLVDLARAVYGIDLTSGQHLSVRDLANVFAAFRWGGLLKLHRTSAMEFPYSVAGLTIQHLNMRWPRIADPNTPDKPGSRFRRSFGAVPIVLGLNYPAAA